MKINRPKTKNCITNISRKNKSPKLVPAKISTPKEIHFYFLGPHKNHKRLKIKLKGGKNTNPPMLKQVMALDFNFTTELPGWIEN